jgi:hypothetical protein
MLLEKVWPLQHFRVTPNRWTKMQGTEHFNFSDYAVHSLPLGLRALGLLGSIDGQRGLQITRAYVRAFFDTYLNNTPSPLLRGSASAYPEVQFYIP